MAVHFDLPPWFGRSLLLLFACLSIVRPANALFAELPFCHAEAPFHHQGLLYQFRKHVLGQDPVADFRSYRCEACRHVMHSYFESSPAAHDQPHNVGVEELLGRGDYCHQVVMLKLGFVDNFYDSHESEFWLGMDHNHLLHQHCMEFFNAFFDGAAYAPGHVNASGREYEDFVFTANSNLHVLGFFKYAASFQQSWESCPFSEYYPTSGIERMPVTVTMGRYLSARMTSGIDFPGCNYIPQPNGVEGALRDEVLREYGSLGFRQSARGINLTTPIFENHPCAHLGCCDVDVSE